MALIKEEKKWGDMMNRMHMPKQELIMEVLKGWDGECKFLDEWLVIINDELPKQMRMTKKSFDHIITGMGKSGYINLEIQRTQHITMYTINVREDGGTKLECTEEGTLEIEC